VPAVLVAVAGATVVSAVLDLAARGVKTVGTLPQGVPVPALPWTKWSDVGPLLVGAVGIISVSLTDTIAATTSFAARDQVRRLAYKQTPAWIVPQCKAVTDIDVTAAEVLKALDAELNDRGVHSAFVEPRGRLQDLLRRCGLNATLDREHFYPGLGQALDAISNAAEDSPMPPDEGMPPP
jgi:MFS superfamily sulfate permease-like transporter